MPSRPSKNRSSRHPLRAALAFLFLLVLGRSPAAAQERGAAALGSLVAGLGTSARVLVIAAHPDDEDTQLITWLAKGRHVETAYLSLTRGDGGQNLIGNELGEALGAIRTEELLAARRIDGGKQYFTRAFDFGFSKNAEETLTQWSRDSILRDVVTVVRTFRPHVIVAVFSGTPADGHGHHQVSGILAREAYDVSSDTARFPRSATAGLGPWTVQKFYRGAFFRNQERATIRMNVGEYDPILGRSYSEVAADSRSQHKSQAFGVLQQKGPRFDQLVREATRAPAPEDAKQERSIFDGIDTTWARFAPLLRDVGARAALDSLPKAFADAASRTDLMNPDNGVPALTRVVRLLDAICPAGTAATPCFDNAGLARRAGAAESLRERHGSDDWVQTFATNGDLASAWVVARDRVNRALVLSLGLAVEATAPREVWAIGERVPVSVAVYNRSKRPITVTGVVARTVVGMGPLAPPARVLLPDSAFRDSTVITFDRVGQPWWLARPRAGAMFATPVLGIEESTRRTEATLTTSFAVDGTAGKVETPVVYRYADPIRGEVNRPIVGANAVALTLDRDVEYAPANSPIERPVRVHLRSHAAGARTVEVRLELPAGLVADSTTRHAQLSKAGEVRTVTFNVRGRLAPGRHLIRVTATSAGESVAAGYSAIEYDHIRSQRLYRPSTLGIEAVDVKIPRGATVAYINGVGDNVAPMLAQLGVPVTILDPSTLPSAELSKYSAIVVGPRAYESSAALVANNAHLLEYARDGGTVVVQYGQYEMTLPGMLPFPVTLARPADRVTVENTPVRIIDPTSSLLATPNRISTSDFTGWVQDLSIYMPRTFDDAYKPVLEMSDPGETPNRGALLVAAYGKGTYVYTTLAFFRQLPNGVPGAARLLVNLVGAKVGGVGQ